MVANWPQGLSYYTALITGLTIAMQFEIVAVRAVGANPQKSSMNGTNVSIIIQNQVIILERACC
jgi:hypothetical protein